MFFFMWDNELYMGQLTMTDMWITRQGSIAERPQFRRTPGYHLNGALDRRAAVAVVGKFLGPVPVGLTFPVKARRETPGRGTADRLDRLLPVLTLP